MNVKRMTEKMSKKSMPTKGKMPMKGGMPMKGMADEEVESVAEAKAAKKKKKRIK